jgi:chromosome segregation ATPase
VPGTIGEKYRQAVDDARAAEEAVGDVERQLREINERMRSAEDWIVQLVGEAQQAIGPFTHLRRQNDGEESMKLQDHRKALARSQREKAEAEGQLAEAQKAVVKAKKAVEALVPEVLKA